MSRRSPTRRGAALIIALVILAALLMLGLPFLFTQSSSLTGTRSFANNQQAHLSDDAAENAGIDIAGFAMSFHFENTPANPNDTLQPEAKLAEEYTSLYWSLRGGEYDKLPHFDPATQTGTALAPTPNHVHIDLRQLGGTNGVLDPLHNPSFPDLIQPGLPPGTTPLPQGAVSTLGLAIEDEGGKLDPNYLDALSWQTLFRAAHITDASAQPGQQGPGGLALALAQLHNPPNSVNPGLGRITYLDQLLSAVPAPNTRLGLTRSELEILRPLLSLSNRGLGRAGPRLADWDVAKDTPYVMSSPLLTPQAQPVAAEALSLIDLGTLLSVTDGTLHVDSVQPARMLANPVTPALIGSGTTLVVEDKSVTYQGTDLQIERVIPYTSAAITNAALGPDMPVAIAAPPGINLLQATPAIEQVLDGITAVSPAPPAPAPDSLAGAKGLSLGSFMCTLAAIPPATANSQQNAFALLNPLATAVVLATGTALPTTTSDVTLPTTALTLSGPSQTYAAALDQNSQPRPELLANIAKIHVQVAAIASLPPTGWAVLTGGLRADQTGIAALPEYVYYSSLTIDDPAAGLGTLNVFNGRGLTWGNIQTASTPVFTDPVPKLAGVPPSPTLTITFFAPHELPALEVSSHGVVTVESSATITDPSGRQVAQRSRRVTAQALPQESLLEERWLTQGQIHALLASRQGSLMTSFPRPYPRLSDILPTDGDSVATIGNPDLDVGMRPSTLRTLLSSVFLDHGWSLPLAGTSQTFLTATISSPAPTAIAQAATGVPGASAAGAQNMHGLGMNPATAVTPEGLVCTPLNPAVYLAFPVKGPDGGPFGMSNGVQLAPSVMPNAEILARQIGFWIKPTLVWTSSVPLLEIRMPVANTGLPLSNILLPDAVPAIDGRFAQRGAAPSAPDTSLQNYLALSYDGSVTGKEQLVLRFANGAIEHRVDYGPLIPAYDPTQSHLDTRSLGGTGSWLAPQRPFNDIECRYLYTLKPDCWHLVQVSYIRDTPGAQTITVDGLVGRDITRSGSMVAMTQQGDHLTLPCMVLGADLPAIPLPTTVATATAPATTAVASLAVTCWLPQDPANPGVTRGAEALLPASGYVRIGDEYLSYEAISAPNVSGGVATSNLLRVRRGQRQDTDISSGTLLFRGWPTMPAHATGDLVVPGGYRLAGPPPRPPLPTLLSGGCTLAPLNATTSDGFWAGDAANGYLLWGLVKPSTVGDDVAGSAQSTTPILINPLDSTSTELVAAPVRINLTPKTADAWPLRGFAKVVNIGDGSGLTALAGPYGGSLFNGWVFYYDNAPAGATAQSAPGPTQPFLNVVISLYQTGVAGGGGWPGTVTPLGTGTTYAVVMISSELDVPTGGTLAAFSAGSQSGGAVVPGSYLQGSGVLTVTATATILVPPSLIQFYDQIGQPGAVAQKGDVEWMNYHWLTGAPQVAGAVVSYPFPSPAGQYFLVNFNGYPWYQANGPLNQRGMQRTHGPLDPAGTAIIYPAGTRVLPVQTNGMGVVRTGDVVTIAPLVCQPVATPTYAYGSGLTTTASCWQAVVRYAPTDGFGSSGGATPILTDDTVNPYFAFTEALPISFGQGTYDLLSWPCWNGNNLSPTSWGPPGNAPPTFPALLTNVSSQLPWSNAFSTGFLQAGTTDDRVTFIGASDDRPLTNNPAGVVIMAGQIDALHGGGPPTIVAQGASTLPTVVGAIIAADGTVSPTIGQPWTVNATSGNLVAVPVVPWLTATTTLTASSPLTIRANLTNQAATQFITTSTGYGLVQIGGEIFPYRMNVDSTGTLTTYIDLIGRSLLGSATCAHSGPEPMVFPPIGPVALLGATLAQGYEGGLTLAAVPGTSPPVQAPPIDAPALLISSLDGQNMELIAAPDGLTAPWLRGLYGTCPPELGTSAGAAWNGALVIAWWPRYPSALPSTATKQWTALNAAQQSAMLRSRTYAWASFPLRFYDAWFSSTDDLGYVTLLDDAKVMIGPPLQPAYGGYGDPTFDVFARALASGFDWVQTDNTQVPIALPEIAFGASVAVPPAPAPPALQQQPPGTFISAAFNNAQFAPAGTVAKVDGAELRVLWRYHAPATTTAIDLVSLANLCNRAPTLGQAKLRCHAPAKIIGVESAR